MHTLTINLTKTLVAEWAFSDGVDFERAGTAARAVLANRPMVDVDDLQALIDATLCPFDDWPSNGDITFDLHSITAVAEVA